MWFWITSILITVASTYAVFNPKIVPGKPHSMMKNLLEDILFGLTFGVFSIIAEIIFMFVHPVLCVMKAMGAKKKTYTSILITGAASGIGATLAKLYAKPGVYLFLVDVNREDMEKVASECKAAEKVTVFQMSVTDKEGMAKVIDSADAEKPLDLVVANAGIGDGNTEKDLFEMQIPCAAVNFMGVFNTVIPAIKKMKERGKGQISITASQSSYVGGWTDVPAYGATKAGVLAWGRGLRGNLSNYGIGVTTICPGYIMTNLLKKKEKEIPKEMFEYLQKVSLKLEPAARDIKGAIDRNDAEFSFPKSSLFQTKLIGRFWYHFVDLGPKAM